MTGAFAEAEEDSDLRDGFERVTASVVLVGYANWTRIEGFGFYSALEMLEVVGEVRPTFEIDGKRMDSRKDFADDLMSAVHG